jgi:hypothetical protein
MHTTTAAASVVALGALVGWLSASGRPTSALAQDSKPDPTLAGSTPGVLPRPDSATWFGLAR